MLTRLTTWTPLICLFLSCSPAGPNHSQQQVAQYVSSSSRKVSASLTKLKVKRLRDFGDNEIYVVALASDNRQIKNRDESKNGNTSDVLNQWQPTPIVFERIRDESHLSLSGDGIVLYPNRDPNGMVSICLSVVEQDVENNKGVVKAAQFLENMGKAIENVEPNAVNLLFGTVSTIVRYFKKDDILFTHCHSGFDHSDYGVGKNETFLTKPIGNDKIEATLRVTVTRQ